MFERNPRALITQSLTVLSSTRCLLLSVGLVRSCPLPIISLRSAGPDLSAKASPWISLAVTSLDPGDSGITLSARCVDVLLA